MTTSLRARILTLFVLVAVTIIIWVPLLVESEEQAGLLAIHFLDVGQGDATFIETPDGVQVLIDGGRDRSVLRELGSVMSLWDREIDVVIATHPDSDHIGGLVDVLERYEVKSVLRSEAEGESPTAAAFSAAVAAENAALYTPRAGEIIQLGASTTLEILFPPLDVSDFETNAGSIIMQLRYGETEVLLTGDAPKSIEEYLVGAYGADLRSDILKVGHHGSKTSTAETFVTAVIPEYAVISAAADNPYDHPHPEVLQALSGIEVFGTYDSGTVSFYSDGTTLWKDE